MHNFVLRLIKLVRIVGFTCLAAPIVVLMRLIRPVFRIRLGALDIGRLGGSFGAFYYLALKESVATFKFTFDVFFFTPTLVVSNSFWVTILARELNLLPPVPFLSHLFHAVFRLNNYLPHAYLNEIPRVAPYATINGVTRAIIANPKVLLQFTKAEEQLGNENMGSLGIQPGGQFVCFHARDSSYLREKHRDVDWRYHDYRDSRIVNYLAAAEELTHRGLWAVRIGEIAAEPIMPSSAAVVDYTYSGQRSEFMDIYLGAKCKFMICSETGLNLVPTMFRRPIVFVNWVLIPYIYVSSTGVVIIKKFFSVQKNRLLTYREILLPNSGVYGDLGFAPESGIQLIENTAAEICAAAVEMNDRIDGLWTDTEEDIVLQNQFWDIFGADRFRNPELRIGAEFLRTNTNLLH